MHQTKKGNQWYFGMKAHIGVDSQTKLIHSVVATAANVHDSRVLGDLLHGNETRVWGDSAYAGQGKVLHQGLNKNASRVFVACGLVNLCMARKVQVRPTWGKYV